MTKMLPCGSWSAWAWVLLTISFCSYIQLSVQDNYIQGTDAAGNTVTLDDSRQPALFTRNFGDCLGSSIVNVTRFDVAYYQDNMTVLFHLGGNTGVHNESLMMHIGVFAYGESRFDLTFNPCNANIESLCPMKAGIPIEANGLIPVAPSDVASIPPIALTIPDFEGQAILRIFANSTKSEIGCYSAVVTNGATFSKPQAVGTILGLFTIMAIAGSLMTTVYGDHLPTIRKHHAHSLSIFVVFAVFHHIFFTGALSMNWPSVLSAFWSNYAWAGGMIYSERMQNTINKFLGSNQGNTSYVGAASSGADSNTVGGTVPIQAIYKRAHLASSDPYHLENSLHSRDLVNASTGYPWYGVPAKPGMPLPGNYSGFAGTLSAESIPASNAFMTGFLWLLILLLIVAAMTAAFKWALEGLIALKLLRNDRLVYYRTHWVGFTVVAVLRTLLIAFFMMIFLTLFQSSYKGSAGVTALAAIVFVLFFVGTLAVAGYACFYRLRFGHYSSQPDRLNFEKKTLWKHVPWPGMYRESQLEGKSLAKSAIGSVPWVKIVYTDNDPQRVTVHEDEDYIKKYGWLAARFRRTRWWFFAVWLIYEFVRACFYGGAAGHPLTQVFGLLTVEIIAFVGLVVMKPFEGARLNALVVYALGFSKVATTGLSASFDSRFNVQRITATAIGVVIIVIQGVLTILLMIAIVVGLISSYMSMTRNREAFRPQKYAPMRDRYFKHMDKAAADLPPPPPPPPQEPTNPYFSVSSVRRCPKIEDEDGDFITEINDPWASKLSLNKGANRGSRRNSTGAASVSTFTTVPWGARVHRASWSMKDFESTPEHSGSRVFGIGHNTSTHTLTTHMEGVGPSESTNSVHSLPRLSTPLARLSTPLKEEDPIAEEESTVLSDDKNADPTESEVIENTAETNQVPTANPPQSTPEEADSSPEKNEAATQSDVAAAAASHHALTEPVRRSQENIHPAMRNRGTPPAEDLAPEDAPIGSAI